MSSVNTNVIAGVAATAVAGAAAIAFIVSSSGEAEDEQSSVVAGGAVPDDPAAKENRERMLGRAQNCCHLTEVEHDYLMFLDL